jgi:hypothetical protein
VSRVMAGVLGLILLRGIAFGGQGDLLLQSLDRSQLEIALSSQRESARQLAVVRIAKTMSKSPHLDKQARSELSTIFLAGGVKMIDGDHILGLRSVRSFAPVPRAARASASEKIAIAPLRVPALSVNRAIDVLDRIDSSLQAGSYGRVDSTIPVCGSKHYSSWCSLIGGENLSNVLVIGVGLGIAALAALDLGAQKIVGIDLAKNYSSLALRKNYPPVAVGVSSQRHRYQWSEITFGHDQGIREESVRELIAGSAADYTLVILDIGSSEDDNLVRSFARRIGSMTPLLLRTRCSSEDALESARLFPSIYEDVEETIDRYESRYDIYSRISPRERSSSLEGRRALFCVNRVSVASVCAVRAEEALSACIAAIARVDCRLEDLKPRLFSLRSLTTRSDVRASYKSWTVELARIACLEILLEREDWRSEVRELLNSEYISITLSGGVKHEVKVSKAMIRLVTRYLIPLLLALDQPDRKPRSESSLTSELSVV